MAFRGFAPRSARSAPPARKKKNLRPKEPAKCRFCREKTREVDYKDIVSLQKMTSSQGKLFSRKRSGNCAAHQRSARLALKRARFIGLMQFCGA
jgi:small subunit ribosomal protein S18